MKRVKRLNQDNSLPVEDKTTQNHWSRKQHGFGTSKGEGRTLPFEIVHNDIIDLKTFDLKKRTIICWNNMIVGFWTGEIDEEFNKDDIVNSLLIFFKDLEKSEYDNAM